MAFMIVATSLNAQDHKHEIRIGGGLGIDPHLQNVRNRFVDTNNLEESGFCGISGIQATGFIEYFNHINKHWAIGGSIGISEASGGGISTAAGPTAAGAAPEYLRRAGG